jgi:large subunit ribosomal protein L21
MFAVVEIGGRQYKVSPNEKIEVEKLDSEPNTTIKFNKVLLVSENDKDVKIGQPYLKGAMVEAKVLDQFKGEKILVVKFIPKKRHKNVRGHRQNYTRLQITGINA